jgi:hypothetical protein
VRLPKRSTDTRSGVVPNDWLHPDGPHRATTLRELRDASARLRPRPASCYELVDPDAVTGGEVFELQFEMPREPSGVSCRGDAHQSGSLLRFTVVHASALSQHDGTLNQPAQQASRSMEALTSCRVPELGQSR